MSADPDALVLRANALAATQSTLTVAELPDFSLYGEGRVIRAKQPVGAMQIAEELAADLKLAEDLYEAAHDAELNRDATYANPDVVDGSVLILTLTSGDRRHVVRAANPEHSDDSRLEEIASFHEELDQWPDKGVPYHSAKLFAIGIAIGANDQAATPWPFQAFTGGERRNAGMCLVLDSAAEAVARTVQRDTRWDSDGTDYHVTFRPMLPDETSCADLDEY